MRELKSESIIILDGEKYAEFPLRDHIFLADDLSQLENKSDAILHIENMDGTVYINDVEIVKSKKMKIDRFEVLCFSAKSEVYSSVNAGEINIGISESNDIIISDDIQARIIGNDLHIIKGVFYHNGNRYTDEKILLSIGDCILAGKNKVIIKKDAIEIIGTDYKTNLKEKISAIDIAAIDDFPEYKRSPRIIKKAEEKTINIIPPKEKEEAKKGQLLKTILPPLLMMVGTVGMSVAMGRSIFVLIMAAGMVVTVVFSITSFFSEKKERNKNEKKRIEEYSRYLLSERKKLYKIRKNEIDARNYTSPGLKQIENNIFEYSSRIYERASSDDDFLSISLGNTNAAPTYIIDSAKDAVEINNDSLNLEMNDVVSEFNTLKNIPQLVDLKKAHLGLVGEKSLVHTELKGIISQLCFFQSYHDIEIVILASEDDKDTFSWAKWYPHCKVKTINVSGIIYGENQRDQILGNLTQILKERKMKIEEKKKETIFAPHYIFIIDNSKLIINHSIMEFLKMDDSLLGFSIIITTNMRANLPENIKTILTLDRKGRGNLLMNEGVLTSISVDTFESEGIDFEKMARKLAPLKHNTGVSTKIPESITFFELYGVKKVEELPIEQLWNENDPSKSLAVPLGVRATDDVLYLNLHEKAHGPHGLVAGTTGSGKSETIQSYILSLAVSFSPCDVAFLLIDYKGGGMANMFKDLPHLLGTITNLDGSASMRALASVKSELARRQRIFGEVGEKGVKDINEYTKLYKRGEVSIPLPHLVIIADEFAELKQNQPEFMAELVSAARIGRSLGINLILATQKPAGVVDDQIWSNSKFKLALKVQDESDSKEVLRTPDAAMITLPGRAYLQVGNNEIYELFQSAWSGAEYSEEEIEKGFDNRVYSINDLGQGELLNNDLSEETSGDEGLNKSQLDVTVKYIKEIYSKLNLREVDKTWLPPLELQIVSPYISNDDSCIQLSESLSLPVGIVDKPEIQAQEEYIHDFLKDGNLVVFGASGFGKSTVILNAALSLAYSNNSEELNYYILDLGNSALISLKNLPHTADYLTFDSEEKLRKIVNILEDEIGRRKQLLAKSSTMNFDMYNRVAKEKLPAIVIFIDNYDIVREISDEYEDFIVRLSRNGPGVGIYTVITASSANMVRYSLLNNFKNKIALYMYDSSDVITLLGRSNYVLPEIPGRAMVKEDSVSIMQCYIPAKYENDIDYMNSINEAVDAIKLTNTAKVPLPIPVLPDIVNLSDIRANTEKQDNLIPIGLDVNEVKPMYLDLDAQKIQIIGKVKSGKSNVLKIILSGICSDSIKYIVDNASYDLQEYKDEANVFYAVEPEDKEYFIDSLNSFIAERKSSYENDENNLRPKEFYAMLNTPVLLIDGDDYFINLFSDIENEMATILTEFISIGGVIITSALTSGIRGYDEISDVLKEALGGIVLGNPNDQSVFEIYDRTAKADIQIGYLFGESDPIKIKMPLV